jgi:2'-5' RNA ligase
MRLFIAVNFDDEVKKRLLSVQNNIEKQAIRGNFSRPENLHLTLIFLGETPPQQIPAICSVMEKACQICPSFNIDFNRTGFFKHSGKELWWTGSDSSALEMRQIEKLHQYLSDGLRDAGVKFDERPFKPHITLGREIRRNQPIDLPEENISIPVKRVSLMRSEHINKLLTYTEIGHSLCCGS